MKTKIYNLFRAGLLCCGVAAALTACSPDEFSGADANGLPTVSGVDFNISVDQETNQMVATYTPQAGTYPVWILDGTSYSTLNEVGYKNDEAGTHTVELRIANRNGISQAGVKKEYTFNETKIDYSADFRRITGKEWRFANKEEAHLACGPAGTAGKEWWSAQADEKKGTGMYDDRITFTADTRKGGTFTYNAGEDGLTYINKGVAKWGTKNEEADVDFAVGNQSAGWSFEVYDWKDAAGNVTKQTYIQLAANTAFPYISSDAQYENPRFRIEQLTAKKLVLIYDDYDETGKGVISWRFIFTSEEAEKEWDGFDADSQFNMWKGITPTMEFWYAPGWSQIADPGFKDDGNDYTITLPEATTDQWQAQVKFHTDLTTNAATNYDFSAVLNSDKDLTGATVKLVLDGDDGVFYFTDRIDLKAGEDYIFWKSDMPGIDMPKVMLVLDFGGCQAGTTVNVSNIVLKKHADDDGTVPPNDDKPDTPDVPTMDWDYESGANLWKAVDDGTLFDAFGYWFADNSWTALGTQPEAAHSGDTYEITLPEGMGGSQWQGQFHIDTKLTALASKAYNFYFVMEADSDCPQVTVKLTDSGDTNFFCEGRHDIKADEPFIFKLTGASLKEGTDASAIRLFFDFGGSPAGTHIKISKIYFEEIVSMSYDDASNLWKAVDSGDAFISVTPWFANDGWSQIGDPVWKYDAGKWSLTIPEGMGGSQWQGQFPINTTLTASQADAYNFSCTILADNDCPGVTIKLTETDDADGTKHDGNFFFADRHNVNADEPFVYQVTGVKLSQNDAHALSLFFDFGGTPIGTNIIISDIIFEKAQ
ncbi:MAG: hypothetical protein IKQ58_06465 [Prevotella sp.]|nr:hypothetical protein [Prevotella sp.]